jgi:competence protein ComFC
MSIKGILNYFLDFIFPKTDSVFELESLSMSELLKRLPPAREINDEHLVVLFDYKNSTVREMIWELKYKGNRNIGHRFAEILFDVLQHELAERILFEKFINPILIPLPISNIRRRERGWNQTEIVCQEIQKLNSQNLFEYAPSILVKNIHTASQARTHATKRERLEKILNRNIILLDDVTTSGSTFKEACRALKLAGARRILCVALAH